MSTLTSDILAARSENRPPMLEKGNYDTWQSRMLMEIVTPTNEETRREESKRMQTMAELTEDDKKQMECDIKGANIILQGLPNDIYSLQNHM
ncbi:hypothetical protein Tco_0806943 [Tanacetum coccineum]